MPKYNVSIIADIVRTAFQVEAENEEIAFELWQDTKIRDMVRVDVSDTDIVELS